MSHSGWVQKQGGVFRTWRRRWMLLDGDGTIKYEESISRRRERRGEREGEGRKEEEESIERK